MQTQCPECQTTYRITESQLQAAQGRVRCGQCTTIFNAQENIVQEQAPAPEPEPEQPVAQESVTESEQPKVEEPAEEITEQPPEQSVEEDPSQGLDFSLEDDILEIDNSKDKNDPSADLSGFNIEEDDDGFALSEAFANDDTQPEKKQEEEDDDDFDLMPQAIDTEESEEDEKPPAETEEPVESFDLDDSDDPITPTTLSEKSDSSLDAVEKSLDESATLEERYPWLNWVWIVGSPILVVVLAFQYIYFIHKDLAVDPSSRGFAEGFCAIAGCELPPYRDLSLLAITEKEIRSHPSVKSALIIRASLINQATIPQAFPRLEIKLLDVNSNIVAARRFEPEEYLGPDVVLEAGMLPGLPVNINLETKDPGTDVVAFEFGFV